MIGEHDSVASWWVRCCRTCVCVCVCASGRLHVCVIVCVSICMIASMISVEHCEYGMLGP